MTDRTTTVGAIGRRVDETTSPPRRSRRSPSLSPLSRHRKLQRENKERAEKTAARKARAGGDSVRLHRRHEDLGRLPVG